MARVSNSSTDTANRMIEKVVALHSECRKYQSVSKSIAKLDPKEDSETIEMQRDYLKKIVEDRNSIVTTILGMHEKSVTKDFETFLSFARSLANEFANDSDATHQEIYLKFENSL